MIAWQKIFNSSEFAIVPIIQIQIAVDVISSVTLHPKAYSMVA